MTLYAKFSRLLFATFLTGLLFSLMALTTSQLQASPPVIAEPTTTQTITLTPSKDNTLYENATGSLSNGSGNRFFAGQTNSGNIRRAVLAFDIAGNLPADATIVDTTLELVVSKVNDTTPRPMTLHTLEQDWGEGTSTGSGGGGTATTGDATWIHTFFDTSTWNTAGGDFAPAASATTNVGNTGTYQWTSTQLNTDVQNWLDNGQNFGWLLMGDETANATAKQIHSRESSAANQPQLTIIYTVPDTAPDSVTIDGPITGFADTAYSFTASTQPSTTTTPITYTINASEQSTLQLTDGLTTTFDLTWSTVGTKTITVTAANSAGTVTDTFTINIITSTQNIYLPFINTP